MQNIYNKSLPLRYKKSIAFEGIDFLYRGWFDTDFRIIPITGTVTQNHFISTDMLFSVSVFFCQLFSFIVSSKIGLSETKLRSSKNEAWFCSK